MFTFRDVVHAELEKQLIKSQAIAGTAILMEVKTGAIKAISISPSKTVWAWKVLNTAHWQLIRARFHF